MALSMMPRGSTNRTLRSIEGTVGPMATVEQLAERFRASSRTQRARAPFSAGLCTTIAEHPDLVALLQAAPDEQQQPVLLLATLHDEVLRDPHCELAAWYPTVVEAPRGGDIAEALVTHVDRRRGAIVEILATRSTQTNEVGRCGLLVPALGLLADEVGELALVDVGTSGGLNLLLDHYRYRYEPGGSVGGASPVELSVGTRGSVPVPTSLPHVSGRIGLDRRPIDVHDDDDARWLRACVWPDQHDRFQRLDAAVEIARSHDLDIRAIDAVRGLTAAVTDARSRGHPVVMNSWVLSYLSPGDRVAYVAELDRLGERHDVSWVFAESPGQADGLPFPADLAGRHMTAVMLVRWRRGVRSVEHLAVGHHHGYWLHWADA
jgi:hypothetical protein